MTILDCCISLKMIKKVLVVLGVVDMRQLLLIHNNQIAIILKRKKYRFSIPVLAKSPLKHGFSSIITTKHTSPTTSGGV